MLPDEVLLLLFSKVADTGDLIKMRQVCSGWRRVIEDPSIWYQPPQLRRRVALMFYVWYS